MPILDEVRITELPGADPLAGPELIPLVQDGVTKSRSAQNLVLDGGLQDHLDAADPHDQYAFRVLNNLTSNVDPVVTNDSSEGYSVLSKWLNNVTAEVWLCLDATVGAAIWEDIKTLTTDDLGSAALANVGAGNGLDADTLDGIDSLGFDAAGAADTAVSDHVALPDPHAQYAEIAGGAAANFTTMPQVGGDPVVESGSNADGEWTRWSDGTQSCHAKQKKTSSAVTTSLGSMYRSSTQTWTFPVAFSADTYGVSGVSLRGDGYSGGSILADPSWGVELTEFKYVLLSTVSSASLVRNVSTHAIGRWQ